MQKIFVSMQASVMLTLCVLFAAARPAQAEIVDPAPSQAVNSALADKDYETHDILLLREANACLSLNPGEADCTQLLLRVRERTQSYNYFDRDQGPPSSWDPDRPSIVPNPANASKAEQLAALAATRVLNRYNSAVPALVYGEHRAPVPDDPEALRTLVRALPNLLHAGEDPALPALANAIAIRLYRLGDEQTAYSVFTGSISQPSGVPETIQKSNGNPVLIASLLNNQYVLSETMNNSGDVASLERARDILQHSATAHEELSAIIDLNLARALDRDGRHAEADAAYASAITRLRKVVNPGDPRIGLALAARSSAVAANGRLAEAQSYLRTARDIAAAGGWVASLGIIEADLEIGRGLPSSKSAETFYRAAIDIDGKEERRPGFLEEIATDPTIPDDRRYLFASYKTDSGFDSRASFARERLRSQLYSGFAKALNNMDRQDEAKAQVDLALEVDPYNTEAKLLRAVFAIGDPSNDLVLARNELQVMLMAPIAGPERVMALQLLGVIQLKKQNLFGAIDAFQAAGEEARKRIGQVHDFDAAERRELLVSKDTFAAQTFADMLGAKIFASPQAGIPARYTPPELVEDGFAAAQWALQTGAAGALTRTAARFAQGSSPVALLELRRESLARQRDAAERAYVGLLSGSSPERVAAREAAGGRRDAIAAELLDVSRQIAALDPAYAELSQPAALSIAETQALLSTDEGLLMLFPTDYGTYAFGLSRDKLEWTFAENLKRPLLNDKIDRLREMADGGKSTVPFDRQSAFDLYQQLVAPVESAFADKPVLMTVTGEALGKVPLALLVTTPPAGIDTDPLALRSTTWLADRYALTSLPALSSLKALRCWLKSSQSASSACRARVKQPGVKKAATDAPALVGFGAPALLGAPEGAEKRSASYDAAFTGGLADGDFLRGLAYLPGAKEELSNLQGLFPAQQSMVVTGTDATEGAAKDSTALSEARFVIFSTHGLLAGEGGVRGEPGLVFTPPPDGQAGPHDDGLLTASEAAELRLQAELVVLSACNTAAADGSSAGEGLSGLARGFLYAGARSLLVSHWRVSDAATSTLMSEMFARLEQGEPGPVALNEAMAKVRSNPEWSSPVFWAPFVLVGVGD